MSVQRARAAGDRAVVLSDLVTKVENGTDLNERVLCVTDRAVYNLEPGVYTVKRRIALKVWPPYRRVRARERLAAMEGRRLLGTSARARWWRRWWVGRDDRRSPRSD